MTPTNPVTMPCVCGGSITAPDIASSRPYVQAHGRSLTHLMWRYRMGLAESPLGAPDDPRRHWPTADESSDLSCDGVSASTNGVGGAS